jgi:hypothetical protein
MNHPPRLTKVEIKVHPEGASVCLEGVVPLPREHPLDAAVHREKYLAAVDQVKRALPELLPLLVHHYSQPRTEIPLCREIPALEENS